MSTAKVSKKIKDEAARVKKSILDGKKPEMKFPLRALTNVRYQPKVGYLEMKGRMKERTLTVNTVKTFAQTLRMMALSKQLVDTDDIATKREAYYVSKNWDDARFRRAARERHRDGRRRSPLSRQPRAARLHSRREGRRDCRQALHY
jgi:DNA topoisomerase VI subunit A